MMEAPTEPDGWNRLAQPVALVAIALLLLVFVRQGLAAWEASHVAPGAAQTTGCEEETFFALWRVTHDQPIYTDETRLPFASAYFNWFFYAAYAWPLRVIGAGDDGLAIIRIGRLLTAAGALGGAAVFFFLLRPATHGRLVLSAAVTACVFLGPVVGWWAHSVRPDIWALGLEATALVLLARWHRTHPWRATIAALVFTYAAWACKQTYVGGLATAVLFLAWHRRWLQAVALAAGSVALWAGTFVALGPLYRATQRSTANAAEYYVSIGFENLLDFLKRGSPLLVLALAALWSASRKSRFVESTLAIDIRRLGTLGFIVTLPLAFAAGCKFGAVSNYYFSPALMIGFMVVGHVGRAEFSKFSLSGLLAMIALQLTLLLGIVGHLGLSENSQTLAARWTAFRDLPEPRFSHDTRLNLPWLSRHSPPLVLAFNYDFDRRSGASLEAGGVGGLIESGYFASLLLPDYNNGTEFGGRLYRYIAGESVAGMIIYRRKAGPTSP